MDDDTSRGALDIIKTPAIYTAVGIVALLGMSGILTAAWDLFVSPMWGMPQMTFGESIGAALLVALWFGVTYMLREDSE